MNCRIVTDSSANIGTLRGEELLLPIGFRAVPLKIHTAAREYVDDDGLDVASMVADLRTVKGKSGSSCPNFSDWSEAFRGADMVFAYTISSNLSGSYASACSAAEAMREERPDMQIHVFDSLSTGPEMQLMIEKTAELISAGNSFTEIVDGVNRYHETTHLTFSLESLHNLAVNGRVNPTVAKIAGVLGIRVIAIASTVGTIEMLHKCRGEQSMLRTMWMTMKERGYVGGKVRIAHCFNESAAEALTAMIRAEYRYADIERTLCRGLCSFYAEKGGLLVGFESA